MEKKQVLNIDRQDRPYECCRNTDNLHVSQTYECCRDTDNLYVSQASETLFIETCRTCGCRHFVMVLDPVPLGVVIEE